MVAYKKKTFVGQVFLAGMVVVAVAMKGSALFLVVAMAPTLVAWMTDSSRHKAKTLAVGAINLAGSSPFLLEIWQQGNTFEACMKFVNSPSTYFIVYAAAFLGYLINWTTVGIVSAFLMQKAQKRLVYIEEKQKELVKRWGPEVAYNIALTTEGLPIGQGKMAKSKE